MNASNTQPYEVQASIAEKRTSELENKIVQELLDAKEAEDPKRVISTLH
jgi:hypothetical protein